jgi:hypothetical protein
MDQRIAEIVSCEVDSNSFELHHIDTIPAQAAQLLAPMNHHRKATEFRAGGRM